MKTTFEAFLKDYCAKHYGSDRILAQACRYALEGEGKRIRPLLTMLVFQLFEEDLQRALPFALAVEMVHTYSLVHDDLPCMDNDDLRRGRPTVHKVFGEAMGVLVGDSLLTDAMDVACEAKGISDSLKIRAMGVLAKSIGGTGMVLGQAQDMYWTGREHYTLDILEDIHRRKTGALIAASCAVGAIIAGADAHQIAPVERAGLDLGLAFQIRDDVLDVRAGTGKSAGKDAASGKLTYLKFMSCQEAQGLSAQLMSNSLKQIEDLSCKFPSKKILLYELINSLLG